jgi:hypothetical protein
MSSRAAAVVALIFIHFYRTARQQMITIMHVWDSENDVQTMKKLEVGRSEVVGGARLRIFLTWREHETGYLSTL